MRLGPLVHRRAAQGGRLWRRSGASFAEEKERGAAKGTGIYRNEVIDESAGRAVVAENVAGSIAADLKITIKTKDQVARKVEAAFADGYKCAQKGAGGTVIGRLTEV
jgi:hypothetical protein